jgi:hypothetical protein
MPAAPPHGWVIQDKATLLLFLILKCMNIPEDSLSSWVQEPQNMVYKHGLVLFMHMCSDKLFFGSYKTQVNEFSF